MDWCDGMAELENGQMTYSQVGVDDAVLTTDGSVSTFLGEREW